MFLPLAGRGVVAYVDDVLVYSEDEEPRAKLLEQFLKILWEQRMYPKFKKCQFASSAIEYLGYRIGGDGITPSPAKVKAIEIWPEELPDDTQLKQFLGTVSYCRMFMGPVFADKTKPLVELIKKGVPFLWTEKITEAVKALKYTSAIFTTLQILDIKKALCAASGCFGIRGALAACLLAFSTGLRMRWWGLHKKQSRGPWFDAPIDEREVKFRGPYDL
ncbi:OSJNBa0079C19.6 protein, related [Eimeria mitis]|uniref:OSJNBa0079C19.6 protein, related n=1 Tax=Eimeria mitis TaxID=44415 RepID=U6JWC3_9EIME|nr:OSJNBa0079C19.6 protein, related [Eimeria mitis]CDJ29071.1 OSJNBa0079C19.6 protein, related [Eimeria mitis]